MKFFKRLIVLLSAFCVSHHLLAVQNNELEFTQVYKLVQANSSDVYLITDQGTWQLDKYTLTRIDGSIKKVVDIEPYKALIPPIKKSNKRVWQKVAGVSYIFLAVIFVVIYLYYQSSINKRRRSYYERMKVQQQVLNIASLATGDEVLDCDIVNNTIHRINKNARIGLSNEVYFQSEAFISSLHPDDKSIFLGHFKSLVHGGKSNYEIEYRISDGNAGWVWLVERGCVIERDDNGTAKRLVSSMRDISSIKQEHENLVRLISELEHRLNTAEAAMVNS